jgi:hypothetical protein
MTTTTYTVNVTPVGFDDLDPVYEAQVYVTRFAGICGPADTMPNPVNTIAQIDAWLDTIGFTRTGDYGDVCANGFATATIVKVF